MDYTTVKKEVSPENKIRLNKLAESFKQLIDVWEELKANDTEHIQFEILSKNKIGVTIFDSEDVDNGFKTYKYKTEEVDEQVITIYTSDLFTYVEKEGDKNNG